MVVVISKEDVPKIQKTIDATVRVERHAEDNFENRISDWWRRVRDLAKRLIVEYGAVDTWTLHDTIRIVYSTFNITGLTGGIFRGGGPIYEITAGPSQITVDRMLMAGGILINPKTGRICNYAESVHDGTGQNYRIGPRPFMTDALEIMEPELHAIMERFMSQQQGEWSRD